MIDFDSFYIENFDLYYRYTVSIIKKSDIAKDIVQDTFIKFNDSLDIIEDGKHDNWFKRVIKNKCVDYFRRSKYKALSIEDCLSKDYSKEGIYTDISHKTDEDNDILARLEKIDQDREVQREYDYVMSKVNKLTPCYKLVFTMHEMDNMSHAFIARELGISEGTSKSNLHKAKRNIRRMIEIDKSV